MESRVLERKINFIESRFYRFPNLNPSIRPKSRLWSESEFSEFAILTYCILCLPPVVTIWLSFCADVPPLVHEIYYFQIAWRENEYTCSFTQCPPVSSESKWWTTVPHVPSVDLRNIRFNLSYCAYIINCRGKWFRGSETWWQPLC